MSLPEVIFGCASFGAAFFTKEEVQQLSQVLKASGIERVDTAARYPPTAPGRSQELLGEAGYGQDFLIDTKILFEGKPNGSLTPAAIEKSLIDSLKVLKIAKVNVLYCHAADHETPIAEQAAAFDRHYRNGQFEYLGVSNFTTEMLGEWLQISTEKGYIKPSFYQGQYNLLCRAYEDTLFPFLRKHGIHFVGFGPLAGGFLTGKLTHSDDPSSLKGTRFEVTENNPFGKAARHWYDKPSMHEAVKRLQVLSKEYGISMEAVALRWVLHHSALKDGDGVIVGAGRIEQVKVTGQTIAAGPLPDKLGDEVSSLWNACKAEAQSIIEYWRLLRRYGQDCEPR